jgi:hypothetical protein
MASLLSRAFRRSAVVFRSRNFSELSFAAPVFRLFFQSLLGRDFFILTSTTVEPLYFQLQQPTQPIAGVPIKKTPMEYIADVAPIEVEATVAVCDGGMISFLIATDSATVEFAPTASDT